MLYLGHILGRNYDMLDGSYGIILTSHGEECNNNAESTAK